MSHRTQRTRTTAAKLAVIHRRMADVSEEEAMAAITAAHDEQTVIGSSTSPDTPLGDGECTPRRESASTQTA